MPSRSSLNRSTPTSFRVNLNHFTSFSLPAPFLYLHNEQDQFNMQTIKCVVVGDGAVGKVCSYPFAVQSLILTASSPLLARSFHSSRNPPSSPRGFFTSDLPANLIYHQQIPKRICSDRKCPFLIIRTLPGYVNINITNAHIHPALSQKISLPYRFSIIMQSL